MSARPRLPVGTRGLASSIPPELRNPLSPAACAFKRICDVTLATVLLVVTLPLLIAAVVAIRLDSPGPVLFRQVRLGAGGRRFRMYKLRTMFDGNDESIHQAYVAALITGEAQPLEGTFKLAADPRITAVGAVLRRFSIDELPQLWNVLQGHMSLIGPRPPLPREAALYDARTWQRLRTKPGLTGLWQVNGRCQVPFDEMVGYDVHYADAWSVGLELRILWRTPAAVLSRRGAR